MIRLELLRSDSLTVAQLDDVWDLTNRYIDTVRPVFEDTLRELPELALFRTADGMLVGTTSIDVYDVAHGGRSSMVIYTSSVVVDERYRRHNFLAKLGLRLYLRTKLRHPFRRVEWLFDTFSYKSYLLLARNFVEFWPRRDRPTPVSVAVWIDTLARARYGNEWQPERGIVVRSGTKRLKASTAPIDDGLLADPDIRFFDAVNPGHREGDVLVCWCPLTLANWLGVAKGALRRIRTA